MLSLIIVNKFLDCNFVLFGHKKVTILGRLNFQEYNAFK